MLPGRPDIVLPKYRAAIQVHGCFWHKHTCKYFQWPKTRPKFWREKIMGNVARDQKALYQLKIEGWRVLIIWECVLRSISSDDFEMLLDRIERWLNGDSEYLEIPENAASE